MSVLIHMVLGAIAAVIIGILVLIAFFAIAGFLIHLLFPIVAAIIIIIIAIAGGGWLYAKMRS